MRCAAVQTLASLFAQSCPSPSTEAEKQVQLLCEIVDELDEKVGGCRTQRGGDAG